MAAKMEGVLVTLRFVLVLETIAAISTFVLLLLFVSTENELKDMLLQNWVELTSILPVSRIFSAS